VNLVSLLGCVNVNKRNPVRKMGIGLKGKGKSKKRRMFCNGSIQSHMRTPEKVPTCFNITYTHKNYNNNTKMKCTVTQNPTMLGYFLACLIDADGHIILIKNI
jgi:hypothetical protein